MGGERIGGTLLIAEQKKADSKRYYHPELDVLRFAAFFAVFVDHAIPWKSEPYLERGFPPFFAWLLGGIVHSGAVGVTLFFLLSSYLITTLLLQEKEATGGLDLKSFYIRRSLRIWPLYFVFLAICFWVAPHLGWPHMRNLYKAGFMFFVSNWVMAFFTPVYSPGEVLWSVSVEEQFYLLWPLALVVFGFGRLRKMGLILLAMATATRLVLVLLHKPWWSISLNTLAQLDPIAIGALLALAFRGGIPSLKPLQRKFLFCTGIVLPPIAMLFFGLEGWGVLLSYPLATTGVALIFVSLLTDRPAPWLRWRPLVYLGKISYGLYVFHMFMLVLAFKAFPQEPSLAIIIAFFGTAAAAAVSYRVLERPFLQLKERFTLIKSRPA